MNIGHARKFIVQRGILKSSMLCPSSHCKKFKNIKIVSVLSGQKLSLQKFIFYLSMKSLTSISTKRSTDLLEILLHTRVADWLEANPSPLAKFIANILPTFYTPTAVNMVYTILTAVRLFTPQLFTPRLFTLDNPTTLYPATLYPATLYPATLYPVHTSDNSRVIPN